MTPIADRAAIRVRLAAFLLIAGLAAGPVSTHFYWMLGGTWGLHTDGVRDEVATTGVRVVAAVVIVLLVAAVLVVLARVGLFRQAFVSDWMIRLFAWALAAVFLLEAVAAFTWGRGPESWLYGPASLVIGVLALVVAGWGGAWSRPRSPQRVLPLSEAGTKKGLTALETALLACGVVAPLLYLASDVIAGLVWHGYSFRDQTISELNAIGAPTRTLTIVIGVVGYTFLVAFGIGVWRSARGDHRLRAAGAALLVLGASACWAVPFASMHLRGAETSLSDTMHLLNGGFAGLLLLVAMWFGAAAFERDFASIRWPQFS